MHTLISPLLILARVPVSNTGVFPAEFFSWRGPTEGRWRPSRAVSPRTSHDKMSKKRSTRRMGSHFSNHIDSPKVDRPSISRGRTCTFIVMIHHQKVWPKRLGHPHKKEVTQKKWIVWYVRENCCHAKAIALESANLFTYSNFSGYCLFSIVHTPNRTLKIRQVLYYQLLADVELSCFFAASSLKPELYEMNDSDPNRETRCGLRRDCKMFTYFLGEWIKLHSVLEHDRTLNKTAK